MFYSKNLWEHFIYSIIDVNKPLLIDLKLLTSERVPVPGSNFENEKRFTRFRLSTVENKQTVTKPTKNTSSLPTHTNDPVSMRQDLRNL